MKTAMWCVMAAMGWLGSAGIAWAAPYQESGGQVVMEAENADANISRNSKTWTLNTATAGFSGAGYLIALPNNGAGTNAVASSAATTNPEVQFQVTFTTTGTYYIWVRGYAASTSDDNIHAGLDRAPSSTTDKFKLTATGAWNWTKTDNVSANRTITISSAGTHTIYFWMYEDGFALDKIVLTTSSSFTPSGTGPAESPRGTAPTISGIGASSITASSATIAWTTNEASTSQVDYGTTTNYDRKTPLDPTLVTSHRVLLSGLTANTDYHYRVRAKNAAGNEAVSGDSMFKTAAANSPPTGSIIINGGAMATKSLSVTLTLSATDDSGAVAQMKFSNDNLTYSNPEAYATSKTWTLASGEGEKKVWVKFSDAAGLWTSTETFDTIILDMTAPTVTITSPSDGAVITP